MTLIHVIGVQLQSSRSTWRGFSDLAVARGAGFMAVPG